MSDRPELRASDNDRERTVVALRHHAAAGRLTVEELDERSAAAFAARTVGDLAALTTDLPAAAPAAPAAAPAPARAVAPPQARGLGIRPSRSTSSCPPRPTTPWTRRCGTSPRP